MRHVSLNNSIRREIVRRVLEARREEIGPPPTFSGLATASELKERDRLRREEDAFRRRLVMALDTYRSTTELVADWPDMEGFIPLSVSNPSRSVILPAIHQSHPERALS